MFGEILGFHGPDVEDAAGGVDPDDVEIDEGVFHPDVIIAGLGEDEDHAVDQRGMEVRFMRPVSWVGVVSAISMVKGLPLRSIVRVLLGAGAEVQAAKARVARKRRESGVRVVMWAPAP